MLQLHERLGDFEIIRLLGKGGMGEVYEARQFNPDRRVALKVLAPWLSGDDDSLARFWREAAVPANLDHPGIVRIISTGKTTDGVAYYTMHLVRGISLSEMIRRSSVAPPSEAPTRTVESANTPSAVADEPATSEIVPPASPMPLLDSIPPLVRDYRSDRFNTVARIGAQAARALAFAHDQGFLHRDIKPSNLMVDVHNQVYLVDFGLTRGLLPSGEGTQPGTLVGTPWYMSPEQAHGNSVDERSDIYSLGITLFELATRGMGPFTAARDNKDAVLVQVRAGQTLPLRMLAPEIPEALEQIILKATQHKSKRRYASAAELAHDLEAFCGHTGKPSARPASKRIDMNLRRRWTWGVGIAVVGVMLIALAVAVVAQLNPNRGNPSIDLLDGAKAEPHSLRQAQADVAIHLLRVDMEPLFQKKVFGKGHYIPRPPSQRLHLQSMADEWPTLLLVGHPHRRNFDLSIELDAVRPGEGALVKNIGGIFFGWQRPDQPTDGPRKCFAIQVDNNPRDEAPDGNLRVGFFSMVPKGEAREETITGFKDLPLPGGGIRFRQPPSWLFLHVKVRDQAVLVEADGKSIEFNMPDLRVQNRFAAENLSPQGGVGIWAQQGVVSFRNATITLRP